MWSQNQNRLARKKKPSKNMYGKTHAMFLNYVRGRFGRGRRLAKEARRTACGAAEAGVVFKTFVSLVPARCAAVGMSPKKQNQQEKKMALIVRIQRIGITMDGSIDNVAVRLIGAH